MRKKLVYILAVLLFAGVFDACQKIEPAPEVSQPIIRLDVDKVATQVGGQTITTGPEKDYEQDSYVIYKISASSSKPLSKLIVESSAEKLSPLSHIVKTDPDNAIDVSGDFIKQLTQVVVYYAYHIDPSLSPMTDVTVTFTFQNEENYVGLALHNFLVIKKGSTSGNPLVKIEMPFSVYNSNGIGTQDNLDLASGLKLSTGELRKNRGPFYSLEYRNDVEISNDALRVADKIDLVGYKVKSEGTDPILEDSKYYLVSPSDTVVLTSTYPGANPTPDVQDMKLRNVIRKMALKLQSDGKSLRKVYFKRLDTLTGPNHVSAEDFDVLTHDNEFDVLLAGISTEARTIAGPVGFDEVYGFVMDDGRRGLIRTVSSTIQITTDVGGLVPGTIYSIPSPSSGNLLCTIKFQDNK